MASDSPDKQGATVELTIPSALGRYAGGQSSLVARGQTVDEALNGLWEECPQLRSRIVGESGQLYPFLILLQNGQRLTGDALASTLSTGDTLEVVFLAGGG